jgi:hypothetical protein
MVDTSVYHNFFPFQTIKVVDIQSSVPSSDKTVESKNVACRNIRLSIMNQLPIPYFPLQSLSATIRQSLLTVI